MSMDRYLGVLALLFALFFIFFVIPAQTMDPGYGYSAPGDFPRAACIAMAIGGIALLITPGTNWTPDTVRTLRGVGFGVLALLAALAMEWAGYLWIAPALVGLTMLSLGERRWYWITGASIGAPLTIWFLFVSVLERALP